MSLNAISENKILVKISIIFMVQFLFKVILIRHMPRLALFIRRFLSDAPFAVKLIHMYVFTPPGSGLDGLFWDSGYEALEGGSQYPISL